MRRRSLFDISDDLLALNDLMEELEGDISDPEVEAAVTAWFAEIGEDRDTKLDNYAALIRECEARAEALRAEATRISTRAQVQANRARSLKERLKLFLQVQGIKKVETARYVLSLANNGGLAPLVVDVPAEQLPGRFQRIELAADNAALRAALEAGEQLEFARLGDRGQSVRIK